MTEQLFRVSMKHNQTGEKLSLYVWAENVDKATGQLCGVLLGHDREYSWLGSGPVYENNEVITREKEG